MMSACGCLPGRGMYTSANRVSAALDNCLYPLGNGANVLFVEPVFGDQDVQPVQIGLLAQSDKGVQGDVAVDHSLHARLGQSNIMHSARYA